MEDEEIYLVGIEDRAAYESENIRFYEWPQPICEIYDKHNDGYVHINNIEDAKALVKSLELLIKAFGEDSEG